MIAVLLGAASLAASPAPLFAADAPLRLEIRGPINGLARSNREARISRAAMLSVAGTAERDAIRLTPRGITRLRGETCQFPPLRIDFASPPLPGSPFAGQNRLKLVTHCRPDAGFQQKVLLEFAAYRLFNLISPASVRVRLATIDYVEDNGRPVTSRVGFFLEDPDGVAARIGMTRARVGTRVALDRIEPRAAARFVLFNYMISNLDWALNAGPPGEDCCHNGFLFAAPAAPGGALTPVPYDFDFSGLVDAPYATPPEGITASSVRQRIYHGNCIHNAAVLGAAAEFRAKQPALVAELATIPGLDPRSQRRAADYLGEFFAQIATDESVRSRLLSRCIKP